MIQMMQKNPIKILAVGILIACRYLGFFYHSIVHKEMGYNCSEDNIDMS